MLASIKTMLAPPTFPGNESQTQRASLLNAILISGTSFASISLTVDLLAGKAPPVITAANLLLLVLFFLLRAWICQGKIKLTSLFLLSIGFIHITAISAALGTVRTPATALYTLVVIIAGLLFGGLGTLIAVIISALAVLGLVIAENSGMLPRPDYAVTLVQWLIYTIFFSTIGGITHWAFHSLRHALVRADQEITERKRIEQALRESEQNFTAFFNTIDDLLFVLDQQGNILWHNATVTRRLGYTVDELRGTSVLMVHPPSRRAEAAQIVAAMLAGQTDHCPVPVQTKDGVLIPVETRVTRGTWSGQDVIFGVTKDISALKVSEEKFAKAFQASPALMAISDLETSDYVDVNDAFLHTLGYTRDQVIGHSASELNLFVEPAQRDRALQLMHEQAYLRDFETTVRHKSGQILHGLFSAEYIQLQDRHVLLTVMNDISEFKREEARIKLRLHLDAQAHQLTEKELIQYALEEAVRLTGSAVGYCHFFNPDANTIQLGVWSNDTREKFCTATPVSHYPLDAAGRWADCARTGEPVIHNDYQNLLDRKGYPQGHSAIMRHLSVPIFEDQQIQVILGVGNKPTVYSDADVRLAQLIGDDVWNVIRRKRAEEKLHESESKYRDLINGMNDTVWVIDFDTSILDVNNAATTVLGYTRQELLSMKVSDFDINLKSEQIQNLATTISKDKLQVFETIHTTKSGKQVPVEISSSLVSYAGRTVIMSIARDITERKRAEAQLRYLGTHDALTGLYNRAFFESESARLEQGRWFPLSVIIADVDNMKSTNDSQGHLAGDELLKRAAEVFRATCRASDIVARIGGDEFAILLPATDEATAYQILARVHSKLAHDNATHAALGLQLSLGVATAQKGNVMDAFKLADARMYADKHAHKQNP